MYSLVPLSQLSPEAPPLPSGLVPSPVPWEQNPASLLYLKQAFGPLGVSYRVTMWLLRRKKEAAILDLTGPSRRRQNPKAAEGWDGEMVCCQVFVSGRI